MNIMDYHTAGGKNLILEYIDDLPKKEMFEGHRIRDEIETHGLKAFDRLNTRHLRGKLWEIKFSANRIMYVIQDDDNIYFLHICKKQKGKAEKFELDKAIKRAERFGLKVD